MTPRNTKKKNEAKEILSSRAVTNKGGRGGGAGAVQRSIYGITVTVCFIDLHSAAIKPLKTSWVKTKRFGADNEC